MLVNPIDTIVPLEIIVWVLKSLRKDITWSIYQLIHIDQLRLLWQRQSKHISTMQVQLIDSWLIYRTETRVRQKQIRFRFSAEFRPFWPNIGFAETVNPLSVSVSVLAETKNCLGFGFCPEMGKYYGHFYLWTLFIC